jgi:hypothetical protein
MSGRAIFISYRRDDSQGEAGRLFDDLVRAYGEASVFMDVDGIAPGLDFRKAIDDNVAGCGVLLAVIGPAWAAAADSSGNIRLENAGDFVRLEIGSALRRQIPVIPVLVHGAKMPGLEQLPDDLKDLRYRNSVELTHARWNSDVELLIKALKNYVAAEPSHPTETVHATIPVQLPAPQAPASAPDHPPRSRMPVYLGIGAGVLLIAGVLFAIAHGGPAPQAAPEPTPVQQDPGKPDSGKPQPVVSGEEAALLGKWKNAVEVTGEDDLEEIAVSRSDGQLMVEGYGKCGKGFCDWGPKKAVLNGSTAETESWELRTRPQEVTQQRSAFLTLKPSAEGLDVTVQNTYHMPNGRTRQVVNPLEFVRLR